MKISWLSTLITSSLCLGTLCFSEESDLKQMLQSMYADVIESPGFNIEAIERYFSPDYVEIIDGTTMNYADFLNHIRTIKEEESSAKITFEQLVADGNRICTVHWIDVVKNDSSEFGIQVIAVFETQEGKIVSCKELTKFYPKN